MTEIAVKEFEIKNKEGKVTGKKSTLQARMDEFIRIAEIRVGRRDDRSDNREIYRLRLEKSLENNDGKYTQAEYDQDIKKLARNEINWQAANIFEQLARLEEEKVHVVFWCNSPLECTIFIRSTNYTEHIVYKSQKEVGSTKINRDMKLYELLQNAVFVVLSPLQLDELDLMPSTQSQIPSDIREQPELPTSVSVFSMRAQGVMNHRDNPVWEYEIPANGNLTLMTRLAHLLQPKVQPCATARLSKGEITSVHTVSNVTVREQLTVDHFGLEQSEVKIYKT